MNDKAKNGNGTKVKLSVVVFIIIGVLTLAGGLFGGFFGGLLTSERLMSTKIVEAKEKSDKKAEAVRQEVLKEIKDVRTESLAAIEKTNTFMQSINRRIGNIEGTLNTIQGNTGG